MTEETHTEKPPVSGRTSSRRQTTRGSPKQQRSPLSWDFDSCFPSEPPVGRIRASSWDDSDDNLPPIPDISGSKTCRIYTSDDKKPKTSVAAEIDQLKKQFFKTREKQQETVPPETATDDSNHDRRLSSARVRRRSRSSGSSSPVLEADNQASPRQTNSESSESDVQDSSPNGYDPTFYLNNFFTELRSRRISLIDPVTMIETLERDIQKYESDVYNEEGNAFKMSRKLSQILEVEESRKDLTKSSEEKLFEKCPEDVSPLPTARNTEVRQTQTDKYKSLSSEYIRTDTKQQNVSRGSLSERSPRFFEGKLDNDFISLSAKTGKTHLASPKCLSATVQTICDESILERLEEEKNVLEALKLDLMKNVTPRTDTEQSYNPESPKFVLNIGKDSARSLKVEDVDDVQRKDTEDSSSRQKTERIPPITLDSPSVESVSTRRSYKEEDTNSQRSRRSKQSSNTPETNRKPERQSPVKSQKSPKSQTSRKSASSKPDQPTATSRTSKSPRTPKTATPRSNRIPELNLDICEKPESQRTSSRRSARTPDTIRKDSDRPESKHKSHRLSTGRSKNSPKTTNRSKDSQNEPESGRVQSWMELTNAASNQSLINSWREAEVPNQQPSYRSDNPETPKQPRSRNSSRMSIHSENSPPTNEIHLPPEEDDEEVEVEESQTQRSRSGEESDRRLSVINEASIEDLETSQGSENEEKDTQEGKMWNKEDRNTPERSSRDEPEMEKPEKEWKELINEFNASPEAFTLEKFPGFQKDADWDLGETFLKKIEKIEEDVFSRNKTRSLSFEKTMAENLNDLVYQDPLLSGGKSRQEEFAQSQSVYYVNVQKGAAFGIGEFGDVTCWNAGDSDTKDLDKPKDHGDGIPIRLPEVRLPEKEVKTPLEDFRDSSLLFLQAADDADFTNHIPCRLKASKSDNCIHTTVTGGDRISVDSNECTSKPEVPTGNTTTTSSGSLDSGKDWDNLAFAYDRTPRLSRSLSNLDVRLLDNIFQREPSNMSDASPPQKETKGLNLFLASRAKEDKMAAKPGGKTKRKFRKKSKEPFHDYLTTRRSRGGVPTLKLRNPNCFQNFYKRFISVFCLTSHSSAATSK